MELKYITRENIDEAHVNITSAEIYTEFKEYNQLMLDMQKKRRRFLRDFWLMIAANIVLIPIGMVFVNLSPLYKVSGTIIPNIILMLISLLLLVYFVIIRKVYNWKIVLAVSLILVPVCVGLIPLAVANPILINLMEKTDSSIRDETGYPHFVQLSGSYKSFVKDGEVYGIDKGAVYGAGLKNESDEPEDPFAKYRIKPEDDMGMLADNDITRSNENG
ncbi:MAG: hypothetical protein K6G33_01875 [Ruminococcus sp.]|uniref:hypothetical protein n=1 Tax=Ruminococcus sp. TaxID=41978 RepID=UPI0025D752A8|nr:hypothetical protein [Ruminococcus sp.]MCR5599482.1 hypothetical protein [Ruminococcus sp.]